MSQCSITDYSFYAALWQKMTIFLPSIPAKKKTTPNFPEVLNICFQ